MANFQDGFNRPNSATVGNGWLFKNKTEGNTANPWSIAGNRAIEDTGITTLMYRASPVAVGASYIVKTNFSGKNSGEMFFRYSATGGQQNRRWSVVITGTSGSLQRRQGATNTTVATWTRSDVQTWDSHAILVGDSITIYDSTVAANNGIVYTGTSNIWNDATGVGVGSGNVEEFRVDDVDSYTSSQFECAPIRAKAYTDAFVTFKDPAATANVPENLMYNAAITTNAYIVEDGIPQGGMAGVTILAGPTLGTQTTDFTGPQTNPSVISVDSTLRFLASSYTTGQNSWLPVQGTPNPNFTVNTAASKDPKGIPSFVYSSALGTLTRPALSFNGAGFLQMVGYTQPTGTKIPLTFAIAGVFHSGQGKSYSILQTDRSTYAPAGSALALKYAHGRFELHAGGEIASYEGKGQGSGPAIIVVSLDPATNMGRLVVQDRRRTSRTFSLNGVDSFSNAFFMGAAMSNYDEFTSETAADMDIFEFDLWNTALDDQGIRRFINQIAPLYGVAA